MLPPLPLGQDSGGAQAAAQQRDLDARRQRRGEVGLDLLGLLFCQEPVAGDEQRVAWRDDHLGKRQFNRTNHAAWLHEQS